MLILLYGSDSYRRQKELNKIVRDFREKHPQAVFEKFVFEEESENEEFLRLREFAVNQSIFSSKKLAILENVCRSEIKDIKKFLKANIENEDFTIIISEERSPVASFKFLLDKAYTVSAFDDLKGEKLRSFLKKEAEERGMVLTQRALNFLAQEFDSDTWAAVTEIDKLSLLTKSGPKEAVDIPQILEMGDYEHALDFFSFINKVGRYERISEKMEALEELFFARQEPAKIFNILAAGRYLSPALLQKLADYDIMVKSGKMDYEEVLLDLAIN